MWYFPLLISRMCCSEEGRYPAMWVLLFKYILSKPIHIQLLSVTVFPQCSSLCHMAVIRFILAPLAQIAVIDAEQTGVTSAR